MVKIITAKEDYSGIMPRAVFAMIGVVIANEPLQVRGLLTKYGYHVSEPLTDQSLTKSVIAAISKGNPLFARDLAKLIARQVMGEDFDGYDYFGYATGGGGVTVGTDPISAIAGAIGSVANLFGNAQKKKLMQQQAGAQTMSSLLAYKAQQEQQYTNTQAEARKHANQMAMLKIIGAVASSLLLGWYFLKTKVSVS